MLLVQEHLIKLGGVKLSGQMKSIEISEEASIEDIEDDKGKTKASQPTGYAPAKISIDFIIEKSIGKSQLEQISILQRLFKPYGQKKAKLLQVVNEDCAVRGISKVYFQRLDTKNEISGSGRTAMLELLAPVVAGIKLKPARQAKKIKKEIKKEFKKSKKKKSKSPSNKKRIVADKIKKAKILIIERQFYGIQKAYKS